jgi:hypothetical protein
MSPFVAQPILAGQFSWTNKPGVAAGVVCLCVLTFSSCATRRAADLPAAKDLPLVQAVMEAPKSDATTQGNDSLLAAGISSSPRTDQSTPAVASPIDRSRRGGKPSSEPKALGLEEWMAGQLGAGVAVSQSISGTLIVSRTKPMSEPLPLFEEEIVLGEIRALVRSSDERQKAEVAFRNGISSVTIHSPLRSRNTVGIISKILEFPEVSEVRVMSRPKNW